MVDLAVSEFGRLDFAVNAAAIEFEVDYLADLAESDWDRMIDVNLKSIFLSMKHEINAMLAAGNGGAIVNIASTNSYRPQPHQSAYTASKFGVLGVTKSAAVDGPRDSRVRPSDSAAVPTIFTTTLLRISCPNAHRGLVLGWQAWDPPPESACCRPIWPPRRASSSRVR